MKFWSSIMLIGFMYREWLISTLVMPGAKIQDRDRWYLYISESILSRHQKGTYILSWWRTIRTMVHIGGHQILRFLTVAKLVLRSCCTYKGLRQGWYTARFKVIILWKCRNFEGTRQYCCCRVNQDLMKFWGRVNQDFMSEISIDTRSSVSSWPS